MKKRQTQKGYLLWSLLTLALAAHSQNPISNLLPEANPDYNFDYTEVKPETFKSFEQAAQWADAVAIVQVINIDYEQTRELNSKGQAFLKVRVPYKGVQKDDMLIVNSKGFDDHVCYYPDREEEGQRFLVFLKNSENQGEYLGFKPYCQLQVLLTDTGEYALRYPMDAPIDIAQNLIQTLNFNDPHAVIDATEWTGISREKHQENYASKLTEDSDMFQKYYYLTYSQGIMMYQIRKLMNIEPRARISSKQM